LKTAKKGSRLSGAISTTNVPVKLIPYHREVFRAFATIQPAQDLLDDLLETPKEQQSLESFYYLDEISPGMLPVERVFRRSDQQIIQEEISSKFQPQNWYASRYSDGTWAVLYSAEAEETALRECLFHKRKLYWEELQKKSIKVDLKLVELEVQSNYSQDLLQTSGLDHIKLTSKDESGYSYCQSLAQYFLKQGGKSLRAPSARHEGGICVPIFAIEVVKKDKGHLRYVVGVLSLEGVEIFEGGRTIKF
jgi:RES domain-containing protein